MSKIERQLNQPIFFVQVINGVRTQRLKPLKDLLINLNNSLKPNQYNDGVYSIERAIEFILNNTKLKKLQM